MRLKNYMMLMILGAFIINCGSSIGKMQKENPDLYNLMVDKTFCALSPNPNKLGVVLSEITFNSDGSYNLSGNVKGNGEWGYENGEIIFFIPGAKQKMVISVIPFSKEQIKNTIYAGIDLNFYQISFFRDTVFILKKDLNKIAGLIKEKGRKKQENQELVIKNLDKTNIRAVYDAVENSDKKDKNAYFYELYDKKLLDQKALAYLNKKFPKFTKYFEQTLILVSGEEKNLKIWETLRVAALTKNKAFYTFYIKKTTNGFSISIADDLTLYFSIENDKAILNVIKVKNSIAQEENINNTFDWMLNLLKINVYPDYDYLDIDMLNNLK